MPPPHPPWSLGQAVSLSLRIVRQDDNVGDGGNKGGDDDNKHLEVESEEYQLESDPEIDLDLDMESDSDSVPPSLPPTLFLLPSL